jgi:hypothetical protein
MEELQVDRTMLVSITIFSRNAPIQRQTQLYPPSPDRGIAGQERNYPQVYSIFPDAYQD